MDEDFEDGRFVPAYADCSYLGTTGANRHYVLWRMEQPAFDDLGRRLTRSAWTRALDSVAVAAAVANLPKVEGRVHLLKGAKKQVKRHTSEAAVQKGCIELLDKHPKVVKWWRQNTGSAKMGGRFVKFSFTGAPDLMGVLKGGRFLAVEVKATGKTPSEEQQAFLDAVNEAGGLAMCVDDVAKLAKALEGA